VSRNTSTERNARDFYVTPDWCARALFHELVPAVKPRRRVVDLGHGGGVFGRVLQEFGSFEVTGVDIEASSHLPGYDRLWMGDAIAEETWRGERGFALVVSNPPYSLAMGFIERGVSLLMSTGVAAFLVNAHVFGSSARMPRWRALDLQMRACGLEWSQRWLTPRPAFDPSKKSTDATEYLWLIAAPRGWLRPLGWYARDEHVLAADLTGTEAAS